MTVEATTGAPGPGARIMAACAALVLAGCAGTSATATRVGLWSEYTPVQERTERVEYAGFNGAPAAGEARRFRVTLAVRQELGFVSGRDVCGREAQLTGGFGCFREDGTQYHGTPLPELTPPSTRLEPATTRVLAGLDYLVLPNVTAGVRAGLVARGLGPRQDGAAAPAPWLLHGEVRAAYWFGAAPFARDGLRLGVFVAGGTAQVDSAFRVQVAEDPEARPAVAQPNNPPHQTLDVHRKAGTGFAGGGLTLAYGFLERSAVIVEVMGMGLFPSDGAAVAPSIGYEHAF